MTSMLLRGRGGWGPNPHYFMLVTNEARVGKILFGKGSWNEQRMNQFLEVLKNEGLRILEDLYIVWYSCYRQIFG